MKLAILGSRGIPARYGGFETFAQEISARLTTTDTEIVVICESREDRPTLYLGVKLEYSRFRKSGHPLLFYLDSIIKASKSCDVLLVLGTGGSFFYLIPRLFGRSVITNVDGIESRRSKWSLFKRFFIKASEYVAIKLSDKIIADSEGIKKYLRETHQIKDDKISVIEYGASINKEYNLDIIKKLSLVHEEYYLVVCRLEPENNVHMIIEGYLKSRSQKKLVIVGNLTRNKYVDGLLLRYKIENIIFLGGIYDKKELEALRYSCFAYIHGHSVGGTNPSLLEALGSGNIAICHDNVFNREATNSNMYYFNNAIELSEKIRSVEYSDLNVITKKRQVAIERIMHYYNWERIALKYQTVLSKYAVSAAHSRSGNRAE